MNNAAKRAVVKAEERARATPARRLDLSTFDPQDFDTLPNIHECGGGVAVGGKWECPGDEISKPARLPFAGVCKKCATEAERREFDAALVRPLKSIPDHFLWAVPKTPLAEARIQQWKQVQEDLAALLADNQSAVFIGDARRGKTSAACLALRWIVDQGRHATMERAELVRYHERGLLPTRVTQARGARFVAAEALKRETSECFALEESAVRASVLVLDDIGAELDGAPLGSGYIPGRIGRVKSVIERRANREGVRTFYTTAFHDEARTPRGPEVDLYRDRIARWYGDGIAGRMFEHALIVDVGRWPDRDGAT